MTSLPTGGPGWAMVTAAVVHSSCPELRFTLTFTQAGHLVGLEVTNWWVTGGNPPYPLEEWGPIADRPLLVLNARRMRELPLGEVEAAARRELAIDVKRTPEARKLLRTFGDNLRTGRRGRPPAAYAALAARYVELLKEGRGLPDLARDLNLSASQVRNLLYTARQKGLLTEAPRGKAGGRLTEKAEQLLTQKG